jgi:hypothetical protein
LVDLVVTSQQVGLLSLDRYGIQLLGLM